MGYNKKAYGSHLLTADADTRNQLLAAIKLIMTLCPVYSSTMSDNEKFTYGGSDRNLNPSSSFSVAFEAVFINNGGSGNIIFDSTGSAQVITPIQIDRCIWNGTN